MSPSGRLLLGVIGAVLASTLVAWVLHPSGRVVAHDGVVGHPLAAAAGPAPLCAAAGPGLTEEQVASAVRDALPSVLPCVTAGRTGPTDLLRLRLRVGCTGAVDAVETVESGDWPGSVLGCVHDRLAKASFPAHGAADGALVDLPIRPPAPLDAPGPAR